MINYINIVEQIKNNNKNPHIYLACTGAAAGLLYQLWQIPGASSFLVGSNFTYSSNETDEFIGYKPEKYCTKEIAIEMAMMSYIRACAFEALNEIGFPIGVGLTASVASTEIHRGKHRVHLAVMTPLGIYCHDEILDKKTGIDARQYDDDQCSYLALDLILRILSNNCLYVKEDQELAEDILFERPVFAINGRRWIVPESNIFLPGAFNPIHYGHRQMANLIESKYNEKVLYSITTSAPHKPNLNLGELLQRIASLHQEKWQTNYNRDFIITRNDPLYIDKARQFPESKFIMGSDAALRMLDDKWGINRTELLSEFRSLCTEFYVFDRQINDKIWSINDVIKHYNIREDIAKTIFIRINSTFDISSTRLRE